VTGELVTRTGGTWGGREGIREKTALGGKLSQGQYGGMQSPTRLSAEKGGVWEKEDCSDLELLGVR